MAALISQNTNLKSLRYGKDRVGGGESNQPYIKSPIPENRNQLGRNGGIDFLLRGGTLTPSRAAQDVSRLTKMFRDSKSPNGTLFIAKQFLLSLSGVKTQASGIINQGIYTPASTILQAGGNAFGIHLNKQGLNPFRNTSPDDTPGFLGIQSPLRLPVYAQVVKSDQEKEDNRLVQLANWKLKINVNPVTSPVGQNPILSSTAFEQIKKSPLISDQRGEILQYAGGPNSILGIGRTTIKRKSNTADGLDFAKNPTFQGRYYVLDSTQISNIPTSKDNTRLETFKDFRKDLLAQQTTGFKKNILSKSPDYKLNRIEDRVNLGDPGRRDKNVSSYRQGLGEPLDKINAYSLYSSRALGTNTNEFNPLLNDLVQFRIGIIENDSPQNKVYIHFRAFLDSMDDQYNAEWNPFKYMGRGENFYRYNGFSRTINLSWTVAAQSKEELIPMYQKLNFLASSLAPDFSVKGNDIKAVGGYMRGNLATLTVGGYLYEQPGIITSINYSVPQESPWEIGISDGPDNSLVIKDGTVKELPHIIKVTGFQFIPIHEFVPRLQQNKYLDVQNEESVASFGNERYIALSNGSDTNYNLNKSNIDDNFIQ
jgi:hypothetical protein